MPQFDLEPSSQMSGVLYNDSLVNRGMTSNRCKRVSFFGQCVCVLIARGQAQRLHCCCGERWAKLGQTCTGFAHGQVRAHVQLPSSDWRADEAHAHVQISNFSGSCDLAGVSIATLLLGMTGNGLMIPRALVMRDPVWSTGSIWGTLLSWTQLLSLFVTELPSGYASIITLLSCML